MSKMTLKTEGDKRIVVTRRFAALPEAVYRASIRPYFVNADTGVRNPSQIISQVCLFFFYC